MKTPLDTGIPYALARYREGAGVRLGLVAGDRIRRLTTDDLGAASLNAFLAAPDWEPNTWRPSQGSNNFYRNSAMPMSMTESFPPADGPSATEEGVPDEIKDALLNPYAKHGQG